MISLVVDRRQGYSSNEDLPLNVDALRATCIHEAGHATISYLIGVRFLHIAICSNDEGEVVPECSACTRCVEYFEMHNPSEDYHAACIRTEFIKSAAIALAGEVADMMLPTGKTATDSELQQDRYLARSRVAMAHLWQNGDCYKKGIDRPCSTCDALLKRISANVADVVARPDVAAAIGQLARRLEATERLVWSEAAEIFECLGIGFNSAAPVILAGTEA